MKLLMLSLDDYPHCGGKSTHMSSLIDGLNEHDVKVDVISRNNISMGSLLFRKIFIYFYKFINQKKYLYLRKKMEFNLFIKILKKHLKTNHYDCISCQDALSCTALGRVMKHDKITLTMHTYFGLEYTLDNDIFNANDIYYKKLLNLEKESLNYAKNVVAVDNRIFEHVKSIIQELNLNNHIYTVINFTNTNIYNDEKEKHDVFNAMCVRRLVEKNGVCYAVKSMKYVTDDIVLNIYGSGPEEEKIKKIIEEDNLSDKVILHGSINNNLLPDFYKKCDIVLVPSITVNGLQEATSISAIEAMSCGIPVIASKIGGLEQMIINEENGLLVEEKNYLEIAKKMEFLYKNPKIREKISKNARKYVMEHHSHIVASKKYLEIFMS